MKFLTVAAALALGFAATVQAAPLDFKDVPAGAKWVAHVDADGMRASPVVREFFTGCLDKCPGIQKMREHFREKWDFSPRKDLHGVTLYGMEIAPHHGVAIVRAKLNKEHLLEMAKKAPDHKTVTYRDYEIHTWKHEHHGRASEHAGAFYKDGVLVLASSSDLVKSALDVLDGKAASLDGKQSPLTAAVPPGTLILARAIDVKDAKLPHMHLAGLVDHFSYVKGQHDGKWFGDMEVAAVSDEVAGEMRDVLKGFLAMVALHTQDAPALKKVLDKADIKADGKTVSARISVPVDDVVHAIPDVCKKIGEHLKHCAEMHAWMHGKAGEKGAEMKAGGKKAPCCKMMEMKKEPKEKPAHKATK